MFEFLFKYPATVFSKGDFVLLGQWPVWLLGLLIALAGGLVFWQLMRSKSTFTRWRTLAIWGLQTALLSLLLFLLWHPAISVATLRSQQNVVAVLLDGSGSMNLKEGGSTRLELARKALDSGVLDNLKERFQVRLYRFGANSERVEELDKLTADKPSTRIGDAMLETLTDTSTLPLGAIVLVSDGSDNTGGIDRETISKIRQRRIPVHTIGIGREKISPDVEVTDVAVAARALSDSKLSAAVRFRQNGFNGGRANLVVREGNRVLATQPVSFKGEGTVQTETIAFQTAGVGARAFQFALEPAGSEESKNNNALMRLVNIESLKPRILYIEGEPRWEFKFIRRALDDEKSVQLVSMLRTTQNKIYRQGIGDPKELEDGFPGKAESLFGYQGLIIGNVEAGYFSKAQQELIQEFANRRGGGILFLGGRATLSDGGYAKSDLAELLPVRLADRKGTFHRDQAGFTLTASGRDSLICRLVEEPAKNAERWKKMPLLADYQDTGEPKPGAMVLLELAGSRNRPLLATENYGRGRTAVLATSGTWRWQMSQDLKDRTHEMFWQQLLRWLVSESPGVVTASTPRQVLADETKVKLRVDARDKEYKPVADGVVEAHITGPGGVNETVQLNPEPNEEGIYSADWNAQAPGSYVAEVTVRRNEQELGRDVVMFRREDGVAENFQIGQNRELLEKLASETGGAYYSTSNVSQLPEKISYSEAGITTRETKDLWDMPAIFLLALLLRGGEWVLRRRWGAV
jgi:uncharacterized membrane protein